MRAEFQTQRVDEDPWWRGTQYGRLGFASRPETRRLPSGPWVPANTSASASPVAFGGVSTAPKTKVAVSTCRAAGSAGQLSREWMARGLLDADVEGLAPPRAVSIGCRQRADRPGDQEEGASAHEGHDDDQHAGHPPARPHPYPQSIAHGPHPNSQPSPHRPGNGACTTAVGVDSTHSVVAEGGARTAKPSRDPLPTKPGYRRGGARRP